MNKLFNKKRYLPVLIFITALLPYSVFASNLYMETAHTEFFVGDTILIDVKVDSEGKEINTVEGKISLDYISDTVLITDINLSESSFSLWPNKPLLSEDLKTIFFTGGVPNGFKNRDATLFKIALNLKNTGQITLNPEVVSVYLNDGSGTKDRINTRSLTINILPKKIGREPINDLNALILEDKTPPLPFEIDAGQDDSVFDGKKFLSFSTTDEQSGIKYYEVREGDLLPTRSGGTYILQNQDKSTEVIVLAVDGSGNVRKSIHTPPYAISYLIKMALIGSILLIILLLVIFRRKKKSQNEYIKE